MSKPPFATIVAHPDVRDLIRLGATLRGMSMRRYVDEVVLTLIKRDNREFLMTLASQIKSEAETPE